MPKIRINGGWESGSNLFIVQCIAVFLLDFVFCLGEGGVEDLLYILAKKIEADINPILS